MQSAIESPRFASYSFPSSFAPFDYYPGRLAIEGRIPETVIAELARRGHEIQRWPDWIWTAGAVCAIDSSTKGAASSKPAPTHAAPPTRSGSSLAANDATAERDPDRADARHLGGAAPADAEQTSAKITRSTLIVSHKNSTTRPTFSRAPAPARTARALGF